MPTMNKIISVPIDEKRYNFLKAIKQLTGTYAWWIREAMDYYRPVYIEVLKDVFGELDELK